MDTKLAQLKYQLHAARVALDYQRKTNRPERDGSREDQIKMAEDRVRDAEKAYHDAKPEPVALTVRSKHFIGPKRKRLLRCAHSDATCIKCEKFKPADQFPTSTGMVCSACSVEKSTEWSRRNPEKAKEVKRAWGDRNRESRRKKFVDKYHQDVDESRRKSREGYQKRRKDDSIGWP
jgi:hypothetical protein